MASQFESWPFIAKVFAVLASFVATAATLLVAILAGIAAHAVGSSHDSAGLYALAIASGLLSVFCGRATWRAWLMKPPGRAAARMYAAIRSNRRACDWGFRGAELLHLGYRREEEGLVLLGAFAVEVDGGSSAEAGSIIDRALASNGRYGGWVEPELWLQGAMFASLVNRDPALARRRLTEGERFFKGHPSAYTKLARAAVLLAEGDTAGAGGNLREWLDLANRNRHIDVGNHWAVDALKQALGS